MILFSINLLFVGGYYSEDIAPVAPENHQDHA